VNASAIPIDSVHLATAVEPRVVEFDRLATRVLGDAERGHHVYALEEPLQPGDSIRLSFAMRIEPRGFRHDGVDTPVIANGTYFTNQPWLPAIGYQSIRELSSPGERRAHGLPPRPVIPSLYDAEARRTMTGVELIAFEAVVGTDEGQVAVAPGALRRSWTEGGRRYFHYSTDAPIGNEYAFFSANYAVREARWNNVAIQILHHPSHTANLDRMVRSVQASLSHYTEQFGPYPHNDIRIVEHPGHGIGMHAEATTIDHQEGFSLLNPRDGPQGIDLPFYVVAHEVAHQWWGSQLALARPLEGNALLTESLASFSAYQVVEDTYGPEHLRRLMRQLRVEYQVPRTRAAVPLLRANDSFLAYRKGPFAMYALSRYMGEEPVNGALRRMLEAHRSGAPPLLTSLDLYRELQTVTPDSLQYLLHDLFEANTFWELETERAAAEQTEAGTWRVTLDIRARKVVVDTTGVETEVPMEDLVEIGVFAPAEDGVTLGEPLHLGMHRLRSGRQTIRVTVPREPARAGIDPHHLLIDLDAGNNVADVEILDPIRT
jgi:aminopeptidase N